MDEPLRVGVLSTANIGTAKVIPAMQASQHCEVVSISSRTGVAARGAADQLQIPTSHDSYEALIADPDVQAVYNPLPNHLHAEWSIAAAHAGKHVLCEKPLARTTDEARSIVVACDEAGVVLMEAFMYRLHSMWLEVAKLVREDRIGRLRAVHSRFSYFNDDLSNIRNIAEYGGGALYDVGCYGVSVSRLMFGEEPRVSGASIVWDKASGTDVLTSATLEFPSGQATLSCSTRSEPDQHAQIWGERGRIAVEIPFNIPNDQPTRITIYAGGNPPTAPASEELVFPPEDQYSSMADAFALAVRGEAALPITGEDSLGNMRVIDAIFAAAQAPG